MRRCLVIVSVIVTCLGTALAQQTPVHIPILNPNFTGDALSCGAGSGCSQNGITGWLCGPNSGVAKFSTVQYPSAPASGVYVATLGDSAVTGSIMQTLGVNLEANMAYVLKLSVGARADYPFTGYLAALMAGNVTVASRSAATPTGGTFVLDTIAYESGASPAQLGQPLQIFVKSVGTGQVNIAGVSLTATPLLEAKQ